MRALEATRRQEPRGGGEKGGWVGKVGGRGSPHGPAHGCCPGGECPAVMLHPLWCPESRGTWLPLPLAAFVSWRISLTLKPGCCGRENKRSDSSVVVGL